MGILDEMGKNLGLGGQQQPGGGSSLGGGTPLGGGSPLGALLGGGQGALLQAVMGLLASGGLQQILASFQQKGLGDVVGSWVSTGANRPVSPEQVEQALGPDQLGQLSQQTGLDFGALTGQLSNLLPGLVDRLTPEGQVPQGNALEDRLGGLLKGLF